VGEGFRSALLFAMLSANDGLASDKDECGAQLEGIPRRTTLPLHLGHYIDSKDLHVVIRDTGGKSLDLVLPGDGSSNGMRTPIVTWAVGSGGAMTKRNP
jgi:hypothetical protein